MDVWQQFTQHLYCLSNETNSLSGTEGIVFSGSSIMLCPVPDSTDSAIRVRTLAPARSPLFLLDLVRLII